MGLRQKLVILENLLHAIEETGKDSVINGNKESTYNLCLIAQDTCFRLISELDLYKYKNLEQSDANHYLYDEPNWKNIPRKYFVSKE